MNISLIAQCLYPDKKKIYYLEESCKIHNIPLLLHGYQEPFRGWAQAFWEFTVPHAKELNTSHILYLDAADTFFISGLDEVLEKYRNFGSPPCIMSTETNLYPDLGQEVADKFTGPKPWCYLNAGAFIVEREYFIDLTEKLHEKHFNQGNTQHWFVAEWPINGIVLDSTCEIFQCMDRDDFTIENGRLINDFHKTKPCILHFNGGYVDPISGREYKMKPWWEKIYDV